MKQLFIFLCLISFSIPIKSQTFEEEYDKFKQKAIEDYVDFRKKANEEYAAFMKQAWKQYKVIPKVSIPKENDEQPIDYNGNKVKGNPIEYDGIIPHEDLTPKPQPKPIAPIPENDKDQQYFKFFYYGTEMKVRYNPSLAVKLANANGNTLSEAWSTLSSDDYNNLIRDCLEIRIRYKLCDWAYYKMLEKLSNAACGENTNEAVLLIAFLYAQSGYRMRLALTEQNKLLLLFNSNNMLFDLNGLRIDGDYYYTTEKLSENQSINICDEPFPNEQPMSLDIDAEPMLVENYSPYRTITAKGCPITTKSKVNKNLINFFNDYPTSYSDDNFMTRWRYYANTPLEETLKKELYPQLMCFIKDKDILTAANMLLNYVQTGLEYEYDDKVWGHDRAFFAEETLYYPYCDCEDRAILYSRLVRDLLGLNVVLVYYPGHMCTAVNFKDGAHGNYLTLDGMIYTVCDPTYIGAPVGATMPGMDNKTAKLILLKR